MTATVPDGPTRSDELDSLTQQVAVGRGLALALGLLAERAQLAERETRAASWEAPEAIQQRLTKAETSGEAVRREAAALEVEGLEQGGPQVAGKHVDPRTLNPAAAQAAREAASRVRAAFEAVTAAHEAVLAAQLVSAEQQVDQDAAAGRRRVRLPRNVTRQGGAIWGAVGSEMRFLLARRPRKVLRSLLIAVLSGALYIAWIRLFDWDKYAKWAPYLAVLFISSVMGTSACFNSIGFDGPRVRVALDKGARLWQILVVKNLALMALVFPLGLAMCIVLAIITGKPAALLAAIGLVLCILALWSGVGNLLSIVLPIRDASIKVHRQEGTIRLFVIEFAITWAISYLVLFLLIWRIYSAKGIGERTGSTWLAVLLLVLSGIAGWINFTVLAIAFANQPNVYRRMRRELDWVPRAEAALAPGDDLVESDAVPATDSGSASGPPGNGPTRSGPPGSVMP